MPYVPANGDLIEHGGGLHAPPSSNGHTFATILQASLHDLTINNKVFQSSSRGGSFSQKIEPANLTQLT
jgi:hypothetical protein